MPAASISASSPSTAFRPISFILRTRTRSVSVHRVARPRTSKAWNPVLRRLPASRRTIRTCRYRRRGPRQHRHSPNPDSTVVVLPPPSSAYHQRPAPHRYHQCLHSLPPCPRYENLGSAMSSSSSLPPSPPNWGASGGFSRKQTTRPRGARASYYH